MCQSLVSAHMLENKAVDQRPKKKNAVQVGKHTSAALWAMVLHQFNRSKFPYMKAYKLLQRKCLKTVKNSRFFRSLKRIVSRASRHVNGKRRRGHKGKKSRKTARKGRKSSRGLRRLSRSFLRLVSRALTCNVFPRQFRHSARRLSAVSGGAKSARKGRKSRKGKKARKSGKVSASQSRAVLRTASSSLRSIVNAFRKYRKSKKAKGSFKALLVHVAKAIISVIKNTNNSKRRKGGKKHKSSRAKPSGKKKSGKSFFVPQTTQAPQVVQSLQVPQMNQMPQMSQAPQAPQTPQQLVPQFLF